MRREERQGSVKMHTWPSFWQQTLMNQPTYVTTTLCYQFDLRLSQKELHCRSLMINFCIKKAGTNAQFWTAGERTNATPKFNPPEPQSLKYLQEVTRLLLSEGKETYMPE